jgi:dihydroorotase
MLWQGLVAAEHLSSIELWQALSSGPARCIGQSLASVEAGTNGYILFDPMSLWQVKVDNLRSRSHNTHLFNQTIQGRVLKLYTT